MGNQQDASQWTGLHVQMRDWTAGFDYFGRMPNPSAQQLNCNYKWTHWIIIFQKVFWILKRNPKKWHCNWWCYESIDSVWLITTPFPFHFLFEYGVESSFLPFVIESEFLMITKPPCIQQNEIQLKALFLKWKIKSLPSEQF